MEQEIKRKERLEQELQEKIFKKNILLKTRICKSHIIGTYYFLSVMILIIGMKIVDSILISYQLNYWIEFSIGIIVGINLFCLCFFIFLKCIPKLKIEIGIFLNEKFALELLKIKEVKA